MRRTTAVTSSVICVPGVEPAWSWQLEWNNSMPTATLGEASTNQDDTRHIVGGGAIRQPEPFKQASFGSLERHNRVPTGSYAPDTYCCVTESSPECTALACTLSGSTPSQPFSTARSNRAVITSRTPCVNGHQRAIPTQVGQRQDRQAKQSM